MFQSQPWPTRSVKLVATFAFAALSFAAELPAAENARSLQDLLASAKPGQTIELPAGEFVGGVTLPAGVSLKGAGYAATIINATGHENGLSILQAQNTVISDLTVRGAASADVFIRDSQDVSLRRVRCSGALIGVSLNEARHMRIENTICDANRYGIVVAGGKDNVVVNCTLVDNSSLGLSLPSGSGTVVFNNLVTGGTTAVYIGPAARDAVVDHNLYLGLFIGKLGDEVPRSTLGNWQYLSGKDSHSISISVKYEDAAQGKFGVVNALDWALDRPVTSGWGTMNLSGKQAPAEDIQGKKRPAAPSIGAYETTTTAPRPADGSFEVKSGAGSTSAGVFDKNGKLVSYLFQILPLPTGTYSFWLPARSYRNQKIEPGEYEVRSVESRLDWEYLGWIANSSESDVYDSSCPVNPDALTFDNHGRLISGRGLSEAHDSIRGFDAETGEWQWVFQGCLDMYGVVIGADGMLYTLRSGNNETRLTRLDPAKGTVVPWGEKDFGHVSLKNSKDFKGLAALGDQLWYTDPAHNAVLVGTNQAPQPAKTIELKSPSSPAGDAKANVVWVISNGEKLVALSPEGKIVAEAQPVPEPVALAARDGRLAVASKKTGKIHFLDAADPTQLKEIGTLGRGDGPDGRILSDRFLFQEGASAVCLALGPNQELAVGEHEGRFQLFDRDGKVKWGGFSTGGWAIEVSKLTPGRAYASGFSMIADSEQKKWMPEAFHRSMRGWIIGEFEVEGQVFAVRNDLMSGFSFIKYTPDKATPIYGMVRPRGTQEPWTIREDNNGDHFIDAKDAVVSNILDDKGQPITTRDILTGGSTLIQANGELTSNTPDGWVLRWPCAGLDKRGYPIFRYSDRVLIPKQPNDLISPYDYKPSGAGSLEHWPRPNGGWMCLSFLQGNPGARHVFLPGGGDLVGVDRNGSVDWVHSFGQYPDNPRIGSLDNGDGVYIASLAASYDYFVLNSDGLSLQGFSTPERAHYLGHWVDHPDAVSTFIDKAGRINVLACDYMFSRNPWYVLRNKDIRENKKSFMLGAEAAQRLAALPESKLDVTAGVPAKSVVHIPQLKTPLPIDGDLKKWRDAGITPQVICAPEVASGIEGGAKDCSALVRLAYHGQDLYLQVLRFDDLITSHQPSDGWFYQQDCVEVCFNGTLEGIKFNMCDTTNAGPVNIVDGWNLKGHVLDKADSPLVIKVLDDAEAVTERKMLESIYGVDMSKCKVQLFETKVPMDDKTYAGRVDMKIGVKPGASFYLGMLIDDNDQPGTDVQQCIVWPATYGTTSAKDSGAMAVFD